MTKLCIIESDIDYIIQFGTWKTENDNIIAKLWFSDEAHFYLQVCEIDITFVKKKKKSKLWDKRSWHLPREAIARRENHGVGRLKLSVDYRLFVFWKSYTVTSFEDIIENVPFLAPVRTPGFKSRYRPPYPQRVVKGD